MIYLVHSYLVQAVINIRNSPKKILLNNRINKSAQCQIWTVKLVTSTNEDHVLSRGDSSDKRPTIRQLLDTFLKRLKVSEHEIKFWEILLEETH